MSEKNLSIDDLLLLKQITTAKILPNRNFLFEEQSMNEKENKYNSAVYLVSEDQSPKQFTSGLTQDQSMKPSPNKNKLAFLSARNGEKAKPEFTLVAPKAREVKKIVSHLKEEKFAFVNGHSGDGKSLAVYHAVRQIWEEALSQKKLWNPFTWGY